jgi:hypothetical protein
MEILALDWVSNMAPPSAPWALVRLKYVKVDKSIILNVSIILYVKGFDDLSDKVYLFPKT